VGRILDAVVAERQRPGPKCNVGQALDTMSATDRTEFLELLEQAPAGVTFASLRRFLRSEGFFVGDYACQRHKEGECSCGPRR